METDHSYEQEIDLKDLLFAVLRQWRLLALATAALAVLLGGFKLLTGLWDACNPSDARSRREAYQQELEAYDGKMAVYENDLKNLTADVEKQEAYLKDSILMNLDPNTVWEAKTVQLIENGRADMVLQSYLQSLTGAEFLSSVAKNAGIELRYLQELTEITVNGGMLTFRVRYGTEDGARKILDDLTGGINTFRSQIVASFGEFDIHEMSRSVAAITDQSVADAQRSQTDLLTQLKENLRVKNEEMKAVEAPEAPASSIVSAIKGCVKYVVLGGVLGCFMAVFFLCVMFLMSDSLYSAKQLRTMYGVKILGILPAPENGTVCQIDRWLMRLEKRVSGPAETEYGLIAANLLNCAAGGVRSLLITGTADGASLKEAALRLQKLLPELQISVSDNMLLTPDTLRLLSSCDGVALVETCDMSSYEDIRLEMDQVRDFHKVLAGFIVIEPNRRDLKLPKLPNFSKLPKLPNFPKMKKK